MASRSELQASVWDVLEMARDGRGDRLVMIEFAADDLAAAGLMDGANRLPQALDVARDGGSGDWLAMIEQVADDLA